MQEGKEHLIAAKTAKRDMVSSARRVEYHNNHRLRRLDGLAELLELHPDFSVCSAITIVGDKILISANSSGELTNYELAVLLRNKWLRIREFLISKQHIKIKPFIDFLPADNEKGDSSGDEFKDSQEGIQYDVLYEYYRQNLSTLASEESLHEVVTQIQDISHSAHSNPDCMQNLTKLLKSLYLDVGPFTETEKQTILTKQPTILLPYVEQLEGSQTCDILIERFSVNDESISSLPSSVFIRGFHQNTRQNNIHCEQMILYFLKHIIEAPSAEIGVSKSCCATCDIVFQDNPQYKVRATSGQPYPNTADLFSQTRFNHVGSPIRYEAQSARHKPSPKDTPGVYGVNSRLANNNSAHPNLPLFNGHFSLQEQAQISSEPLPSSLIVQSGSRDEKFSQKRSLCDIQPSSITNAPNLFNQRNKKLRGLKSDKAALTELGEIENSCSEEDDKTSFDI